MTNSCFQKIEFAGKTTKNFNFSLLTTEPHASSENFSLFYPFCFDEKENKWDLYLNNLLKVIETENTVTCIFLILYGPSHDRSQSPHTTSLWSSELCSQISELHWYNTMMTTWPFPNSTKAAQMVSTKQRLYDSSPHYFSHVRPF